MKECTILALKVLELQQTVARRALPDEPHPDTPHPEPEEKNIRRDFLSNLFKIWTFERLSDD